MANVLSLHERRSSEHKQNDIKAGQDQKGVVSRLKEHGIAGYLGSSHGGLVDGRGLAVAKGRQVRARA